jgi:hypothetical protein
VNHDSKMTQYRNEEKESETALTGRVVRANESKGPANVKTRGLLYVHVYEQCKHSKASRSHIPMPASRCWP